MCTGLPFLTQGSSSKHHLVFVFCKMNVPKVHIRYPKDDPIAPKHIAQLISTLWGFNFRCPVIHVYLTLKAAYEKVKYRSRTRKKNERRVEGQLKLTLLSPGFARILATLFTTTNGSSTSSLLCSLFVKLYLLYT